jgi:arylsulfatase
VFAGFLTHTDAQIGAVLDLLAEIGQLDNTIVLLFSDNGASAEGGQYGSVNEHRFTAPMRESLADNMAALDDWGGPSTYNHYSWAWAWAGNTPHRLWKRYTWLGGTRTPLIVHWPKGTAARGEVRSQFAHAIDLAPTILDAIGLEWPESIDGVRQQPVDGASLLATFDDASADAGRATQYFEMLGSRSIYHEGWKATTDHISTGVPDEEEMAIGSRDFAQDHWELFDLNADFSESTDLSGVHPDVVRDLEALWFAEASRNQVLPVDDTFLKRVGALIPPAYSGEPPRVFLPGGGPWRTSRCRSSSPGSTSRPRSRCRRPGRRGCCSPSATGTAGSPSSPSMGALSSPSRGPASCWRWWPMSRSRPGSSRSGSRVGRTGSRGRSPCSTGTGRSAASSMRASSRSPCSTAVPRCASATTRACR